VNATAEDHVRLHGLNAAAERQLDNVAAYTRLGREFHLAVAEASHNRVLVVQLISLQHVSWPAQNPTLTPEVARRILDVHKELASLIEMRDPAGARRLMDDHVKMIGARRVAEHRGKDGIECC
jgi:GntR family transcriptional regulator, transcriptional repressor for pyruvate dehydrogenase complex